MDECFVVDLNDKYPNELNGSEATYKTVSFVQLYPNEFVHHGNNQAQPAELVNELHPLEVEVQRSYQIKRQNLARIAGSSVIQNLKNLPDVTEQSSVIFSEDHEQEDEPDIVDASQIPITVQYCGQATQPDTREESVSDDEQDPLQPVFDHEPDPEPPSSPLNQTDMTNTCYMCFKKFKQKKNMYAHIRKIHSSQPNIQGGIICPLCKMHSLRQEHLRNHLEALHQVQVIKEERQFSTMQEFEDWKDYIEKETFSYFISKSSTKLLASNQTKTYYKCHRSGASYSNNKQSKKTLKKQTSYKIGATCPASMEVIENVQGITVTFWATHVGHNLLSKNDSSRVRALLSSGMSWDQVLDIVQRESKDGKKPTHPLENSSQTKYVLMDKKIVSLGRKPKHNRLTRFVPQSLLIEKAEHLFNVLETTEIIATYRPIISSMIDNLTSIVKRRAVGSAVEKNLKKRRRDVPNTDATTLTKEEKKYNTRLRKRSNTRDN